MPLPRPRGNWSIRNVLLLTFMLVWGVSVLAVVVRGERPSADDWAVLGLGLGAITALFKNTPKPPGGGGSS